jgi:hypothetical protein
MTTISRGGADTTPISRKDGIRDAARQLYEAECALHDARQTDVDSWIAAASAHLHRAIVQYETRLDALRASTRPAA